MKSTILLVEDDGAAAVATARCLQPQYNVLLAGDGQEGVVKALSHRPDIIVTDVTMPAMGGVAMVELLQTIDQTKDIPVIFLTAKGGARDLVDGMRAGAAYYLTKPVQIDELLLSIEQALQVKS